MMHICTERTDLDELIGKEYWEGPRLLFHYGPLAKAMKGGEELILENSAALSAFMLAKVRFMLGTLFIDDTAELIEPHAGFRLTLR
jgi:midasin (ATPase involved in ribosome maturation)